MPINTQQRRPLIDHKSPELSSWDNPFPGFPGQKKKTSMSEEQRIIADMAMMDINAQKRPQTAGGERRRPPPPQQDGYGQRRPQDGSRGAPRGMPPPQRMNAPSQQGQYNRRGPPPSHHQQAPRSKSRGPPPSRMHTNGSGRSEPGYGQSTPSNNDDYGPPSRSNTMPNDIMPPQRQHSDPRYANNADLGPSAPYYGNAGRVPQRPSTSAGDRPPPQRIYPPEPISQHPTQTQPHSYSNGNATLSVGPNPDWKKSVQLNHLYDDYFEQDDHSRDSAGSLNSRPDSHPLDSPGFMPPRQHVNGNAAMNKMRSQSDLRAQAQPHAAVFEMAADAPPLPNGLPPPSAYTDQFDPYSQDYDDPYNQQYDQQYDPYEYDPHNGPIFHDDPSEQYNQPEQPQNYQQAVIPPRTQSIPQASRALNGNGLPYSNSVPNGMSTNPDVLPPHPTPVRPGLNPPSTNLADNKPAPVRNYGAPPVPPAAPAQAVNLPPPVPSTIKPVIIPQAPVTAAELDRLRKALKSQPNDAATHMVFVRKLMEAADVLTAPIPDARRRAKDRDRYVQEAQKILKKLCSGSSPFPEAQFFLADCYGRGSFGLEPDFKEAFTLYQSAAKAGHASAAYRTAVCCELGNEEGGGTRKDPQKAIQWYRRAATLGDTPAMYKMGIISLKGLLGQPKNVREAVGWLKRAADNADIENPHALHELGLLYEAPQPTDGSSPIMQDEAYALALFTQSAKLGYKFSQYHLGHAYEYGLLGVAISPRDSIAWYSRAAIQDEHQSELALSGWYLTGSEGILQQSDTEAYLWARKSALAGNAKAEYAMGYFVEVGIGAPSDLESAKRWYWRAAGEFSLFLALGLYSGR